MSSSETGVGSLRYGFPSKMASTSTGTAVQPWRATVSVLGHMVMGCFW